MPKLKTHKGAASRLHVTGGGKLMRTKQGKTHFRRRKAKRVKRQLHDLLPVAPAFEKKLRQLVPYGA